MRLLRPALLLAAVTGIAWWAMPENGQREDVTPTHTLSEQPAVRAGAMDAEETATWIRQEIQASANPRWSSPRKADLAAACARLSPSDRIALLDQVEQGYRAPGFGTSNRVRLHLLRLQSLRNLLLEQAARDDLQAALTHFPSGAAVLLKASASENGSETLRVWKEFHDKKGLERHLVPPDGEWLEGVGEVPFILDDDQKFAPSIALVEGWAASDSDAAWATLTSGKIDDTPICNLVRGFFRGLPETSGWQAWTARLDDLPRNGSNLSSDSPRHTAAVALSRRWLESQPDEALAWFIEDKASWTPEPRVLFRSDTSSFNAGSAGHATFVSAHVFLLADWMKAAPQAASSWLSQASETLAPKDVLLDAASEMAIPEALKIQIADRCKN